MNDFAIIVIGLFLLVTLYGLISRWRDKDD